MKTVILDDVPVETTDEGAAAVVKMKAELIGAVACVAAKDGEIDALKSTHASELAAANAGMLDADVLDAAVELRIAVIDAASVILGSKFDAAGMSEASIRRATVMQRLGDAKLADKDDAYVQAAFDTLTATTSVVASLVRPATIINIPVKDAIKAYDAQVAWGGGAEKSTADRDA